MNDDDRSVLAPLLPSDMGDYEDAGDYFLSAIMTMVGDVDCVDLVHAEFTDDVGLSMLTYDEEPCDVST